MSVIFFVEVISKFMFYIAQLSGGSVCFKFDETEEGKGICATADAGAAGTGAGAGADDEK